MERQELEVEDMLQEFGKTELKITEDAKTRAELAKILRVENLIDLLKEGEIR